MYMRSKQRRGRRRWIVVAVLVVAATASVLALRARIDAQTRGYSNTYGATVVRYSLASKLLGRSLEEVGVVPSGTERRALLVLLHGRHDPSRLAWLIPRKNGPESMLSNELFAGLEQLGNRAPVVVLLNGGGHSYYHDRRDGRWGSMILDEAIPDAIRRFHIRGTRVAIGGISMGGYGAFHLAASRPHEFCAVGGHSAALWQNAGASAPGAFDDAADFARNDVFTAARAGRFDALPVWVDGGTNDFFHGADAAFVSLLRARGADVTYHVWPGAHTQSYWHAHMGAYLRFYALALARCPS